MNGEESFEKMAPATVGETGEGSGVRPRLNESGKRAMQGPSASFDSSSTTSDQKESQVIGDPVTDARHWHEQQHPDTCAIVAQEGIIAKHTGDNPGEEVLRRESLANGWYANGTKPQDVGKLMEAHQVPVGFKGSGDMNTLEQELAQGHDVIVGVDAGHLWQDANSLGSGHAVWVTGLETDNQGKVTNVFLNDSGNSAIGAGGKVSAQTFRDAWAGGGNFMVATQESAVQNRK
ncbi:MAG: hypothetical protein KA338_21165 [Chloroflexi bacterium]|nr:hypothetical protein [Chloroflexota bacterium]